MSWDVYISQILTFSLVSEQILIKCSNTALWHKTGWRVTRLIHFSNKYLRFFTKSSEYRPKKSKQKKWQHKTTFYGKRFTEINNDRFTLCNWLELLSCFRRTSHKYIYKYKRNGNFSRCWCQSLGTYQSLGKFSFPNIERHYNPNLKVRFLMSKEN